MTIVLTPTTQNRTGIPWGDCQEAAVASIVGVPLARVPDPRTRLLHRVRAGGPPPTRREIVRATRARWPAVEAWLARCGWRVVHGTGSPPRSLLACSDGLWIAGGRSPRGPYGHAVVYRWSRIAWDPNPDCTGLVDVRAWTILVPPTQAGSTSGIVDAR